MEDLVLSCLESRVEANRNLYARFLVGPFFKGDALTVATALRRVLLSSVESVAITALYIQGITHEFSSIVGVRESVLELSLNFQSIILCYDKNVFQKNRFFEDFQIGYLQVQGPKIVYANDLKLPLGVKVVYPTQYIATVSKEGFIVLKFTIGKIDNQPTRTLSSHSSRREGDETPSPKQMIHHPVFGELVKKNIVKTKRKCSYKSVYTRKTKSKIYNARTNRSFSTLFSSKTKSWAHLQNTPLECTFRESDETANQKKAFHVLLQQNKERKTLKQFEKTKFWTHLTFCFLGFAKAKRKMHLQNALLSLSIDSRLCTGRWKKIAFAMSNRHASSNSTFVTNAANAKQNKIDIYVPVDAKTNDNGAFQPLSQHVSSNAKHLRQNIRRKNDLGGTHALKAPSSLVCAPISAKKAISRGNEVGFALAKRFVKTKLGTYVLRMQNVCFFPSFAKAKPSAKFTNKSNLEKKFSFSEKVINLSFLQIKKDDLVKKDIRREEKVFQSDICLRNIIPLDFTLSPVLKVNFVVEVDDEVLYLRQKVRERIILEVWTNGSIQPRQAVHDATLSLLDMFSSFRSLYQVKSNDLLLLQFPEYTKKI
uniref:RNA polymerase alpha subunit n=1 Tax=Polulichloris maxima TaxID=2704661 RepID=UPI0024110019|nr:RNA polymerase alpha subunit [Polulichloris maxima]WDY13217.1 RNA polymerase alpha subunit [Polulichloris maxima]